MNLNMYEANANENPDNRRKHSFSCRTWTHVRERELFHLKLFLDPTAYIDLIRPTQVQELPVSL